MRRRRARFVTLSIRSAAGLGLLIATAALGQPESDDERAARFRALTDADTLVMMPMRDGVRLATDVYLPKDRSGPVPVVFVKTPYDFNEIEGSTLTWGLEAIERGYAYVVQNERGRYYSEGEWEILGRPRTDGWDALDWLAEQPWSSGKVATLGCSSTAEWQLALAAMNHPAHAAMVPMAAGAGIGRVGEFWEQGNWYKGGVHQTLFSIWLYSVQQDLRPRFPTGLPQAKLQRLRAMYALGAEMPEVDWAEHIRTLPSIDWLPSAGANEGPAVPFMRRKPNDPGWFEGGLYHDDMGFGVPAYWHNSWFDVSQGPNLALFNHVRENASDPAVRDGQFMIIAPTKHCGFYRTPEHGDLIVGELNVGDARFPYFERIFAFLDHYLNGVDNGFERDTPRVRYFTMGRNEWSTADAWPPAAVRMVDLYLDSGGAANSLSGDGTLSLSEPSGAKSDSFAYDPMNPVPALGGGVCCNGNASEGGSFDQRAIEARSDVLVYTGEELRQPVEVTGFVRPHLFVSSDARDTDFTVKLVDVYPDGRAFNVDDTILRARYREGYEGEVFMRPGEVYELVPTPMSTSYVFGVGHHIRVEVSSSKFPQYMRNLNTGGNNWDETEGVVARNTIWHSGGRASRVSLPIMAP